MPNDRISRRYSFVIRLNREPPRGGAMTGWCGTIELTSSNADVVPEGSGFSDLADLPDLIIELMEQRKSRGIQ